MKMKNSMFFLFVMMIFMSASTASIFTSSPTITTTGGGSSSSTSNGSSPWWTTTTAGPAAVDLNGMMFTLTQNRGGVSFSPPYYSPPSSTPFPTRWYTTTHPYPPSTPAATRGLSVCLRYLTDIPQPVLFTVSPSARNPVSLRLMDSVAYIVSYDRYSYLSEYFRPNIQLWPNVAADIWTRICLTIDTEKHVAQMFRDSSMSIRKMLASEFVWSGEPVINIPGFDGQVTDIQVWDYPLRYSEVFDYMNAGAYRQYYGSVLSWSNIAYSPNGNTLMEDVYELQAKRTSGRRGGGRRRKVMKKKRKFSVIGENKEKQQL